MNEATELADETERITNRHLARLLSNLEAAHCPDLYVQAVKSEVQWLRTDLRELYEGTHGHERTPRT